MKIRGQQILTEILLSAALLTAILFSVRMYTGFVRFEDLKIKTVRLQYTADRIQYSYMGMRLRDEPAAAILIEHNLLEDQMSLDLESIRQDRRFLILPDDLQQTFVDIEQSWEYTRDFLTDQEIQDFLELRADGPSGSSLESLNFAYNNEQNGLYDNTELDLALSEIVAQEQSYAGFEEILDASLDRLLTVTDQYRRNRLRLALIFPSLILAVAVAGVFLYALQISRKLNTLEQSLDLIAGGDFSTRVDLQSRDEFSSLAESINTFSRSLGARLESFRLVTHEVGQNITTDSDSVQVEEFLTGLAMQSTEADGSAMYKVSGDGELVLSVIKGRFRPPFAVEHVPEHPSEEDVEAMIRSMIIEPGQTVIGESAAKGTARMIRNVPSTPLINWSRQEDNPLFLSSVIAVPLQVGSTVLGVLVITSSLPGHFFSDLDFVNMQSFGELAAIALDTIYKYGDLLEAAQLSRELDIAGQIQQDLLPQNLPELPYARLDCLSRNIRGLNGDYYDVYDLGDGMTLVAVCEVAGRGVPAGLVMVMIRTLIRLISFSEQDACSVMHRLNQDITRRVAIENYASVGIFVFHSSGRFSYASAAAHPLYILRKESMEYESLHPEGLPVGVDSGAQYGQLTGILEKEDLILLHTDGIPETRNRDGVIFGTNNLLELLRIHADESPGEIVNNLRHELEYFERSVGQKDDQTALVIRFTGEDAV